MFDLVLDWDKKTKKTENANWSFRDKFGHSGVHIKEWLLREKCWETLAGKTVAVESAHWTPRPPRSQSKAQPYTKEELEIIDGLARKHNVRIVLLPERLCKKALREAGVEKGNDCLAYFNYYTKRPSSSFQTWTGVKGPSPSKEITKSADLILNEARTNDYDHPLVDQMQSILLAEWESLSTSTRDLFQFKFKPRKRSVGCKRVQVFTLFTYVVDEYGKLRKNSQGRFYGIKSLWRALGMHPYAPAKRAGTGRSNIMYHFMGRLLKGKPLGEWADIRSRVRKAMKEIVKLFRDAVSAAELVGKPTVNLLPAIASSLVGCDNSTRGIDAGPI